MIAESHKEQAAIDATTGTVARPDPRLAAMIAAEQPGNYFIGRRYYKKDYKMWGWVRRPGQPWSTAQFVMMNENTKLAPDRAAGTLGIDNNSEYRLEGRFTGGSSSPAPSPSERP